MTEKHSSLQHNGCFAAKPAAKTMWKTKAAVLATLFVSVASATGATVLAQAQQPSYPVPGGGFSAPTPQLQLPSLPIRAAIEPNATVVEDVIARVNDQIITRSEYERSEHSLLQEAQQSNMSEADMEDHLHDLLRDMIDQQLLLSKGKELGITGDAETIRELDEIRKSNHMDSLQQLEKAATDQGVSYEDFKRGIRDRVITQQVVRDEVGRRLNLSHAQELAYYSAHSKDFEVPEQVHLSEILIPTPENATDAEISTAQTKADTLTVKLKDGASFAELAKSSSGGPTASVGGDLGDFKHGGLGSDVLENATFPLPVGGNTAPIRTRQGFVILHVDSHQAAGVPPLASVEDKVEQAIYLDQLQPALRVYLTKARDEAYVEIAPGFVDAGSAKKAAKADITYTAYAAPAIKKKVQVKQRVEQEKASKAQADLAAARAKVTEKQAEKAAATPGMKNVSMPVKPKKIHREKIRYGQAPQRSLPTGATQVSEATAGAPITGQAAGVAMAPTESITSITTGTGVDAESDPLAPQEGPQKKTRFASHETQAEVDSAKVKLAKAEVKATTRPIAATPAETASEKQQAAPLGLNGDTTKKQKKPKHQKGDAKERLQEKPKPDTTPVPVAPTVNPALASTPVAGASTTTPPATATPAPQQ